MSGEATAARMLVDTLRDAGVRYAFANFGSDHPAIIEALAADRERGIEAPTVILCPHEMTALSAAHGYAAATGEPVAVFVHTDVGTANLGGAVHNAARSRVPVFIFAGLTPYTLEGELPGTRDTVVNHLQDAPDQHAIVRQYVKWAYDIRTPHNVPQVVRRGLQLALSAPQVPVYLTGAREVLAQSAPVPDVPGDRWPAIAPTAAPSRDVRDLVGEIDGATRAVLITSYLGRRPAAFDALVEAAERLGLAVVEPSAEHVSFPHGHPQHAGDDATEAIAEADVVIAIESDAPWLPSKASPRADASVTLIGEDPLEERIPLWYLPSSRVVRADPTTFLRQLVEAADEVDIDVERGRARVDWARSLHDATRLAWRAEVDADRDAGRLTTAIVADIVRAALDDDTVVLNEAISQAPAVWRRLRREQASTLFGNRGTSLGWSGGGALGVKLARPESTVVTLVGDGTFFFSVPSSTYWVADRYDIPVLTVVLDNGGWAATKRNLIRQHGGEAADSSDRYYVN
ncbi:MAG: thiamine pyrophosphate-requiring protein, partial [Pseudoclavibacter sp.]